MTRRTLLSSLLGLAAAPWVGWRKKPPTDITTGLAMHMPLDGEPMKYVDDGRCICIDPGGPPILVCKDGAYMMVRTFDGRGRRVTTWRNMGEPA